MPGKDIALSIRCRRGPLQWQDKLFWFISSVHHYNRLEVVIVGFDASLMLRPLLLKAATVG